MTLKNSSSSIVRITPIFRCKIVLRLRSAICILISFICILSAQNSFGQVFNAVAGYSKYSNPDLFSTLIPGQALLFYTVKPNGNINVDTIVTYENLLTKNYRIDLSSYTTSAGLGRLYTLNGSYHCVSIIDAENFYFNQYSVSTNFVDVFLPKLYDSLIAHNLGTVAQRQQYIKFLNSGFDVNPVNFVSRLGPWILLGIGIALSIPPFWWFVKRFLR